MSRSESANITPRRSTRHQPQVRPVKARQTGDWSYQWSGDVLDVRPTQPLDLHQGETANQADGDVSDDEREPRRMETAFYSTFTRTRPIGRLTKAKKVGANKDEQVKSEAFNVGNTILIHSTDKKKPNVGVIIALWDTRVVQGEPTDAVKFESMKVKVHWFIRPEQTAQVSAKREHLQNEIYFSLKETATLAPADVIGHCIVSSRPPKIPTGTMKSPMKKLQWKYEQDGSQSEDEPGPDFYFCGLALDARRGLFYDFRWEHHREAALRECSLKWETAWNVGVNRGTSKKRNEKRKEGTVHESSDDEESSGDETDDAFSQESDEEHQDSDVDEAEATDDDAEPSHSEDLEDEEKSNTGTSKKRRRKPRRDPSSGPTTPRKRRRLAVPTPHSQAALRARRKKKAKGPGRRRTLVISAPRATTDHAQLQNLPGDPLLRAMHVLHVGARPDALPCREDEYVEVMGAVLGLVEEGSGGCVYISGVPGTGKTATVHAVVRELKTMAERSETNPFTYVEINGLKIHEPSAAYALLWEAVSGHDIVAEGRLDVSSKEALKRLNHHFAAGVRAGPGGHACVVLMDELDQLVTSKQDVIYNFFNWPSLVGSKLIVIAVANTHDLPERVMSGKVRSRLGMVRINFNPYKGPQLQKIVQARLDSAKEGLSEDLAIEVIKPDAIKFVAMKVSGVSGDARRILDVCRRAVEFIRSTKTSAVQIPHVKQVLDAMQNSPTAAYLRDCSLHERIMLASLLKCVKKEGVDEIRWADVTHQHHIYMNSLTGEDDPKRKPTDVELALVLDSLAACGAVLMEEGVAASRKHPGDRKIVLNIEAGEVERTLSELGGTKWKNALGV